MSPTDNPAQCLEVGKLLLTSQEAATALSISERTLYSITERGDSVGAIIKLRCVRLPNRVMYRPSDIQAWIDQLQANPIKPKVGKPIVRKPRRGGNRSTCKRKDG